MSSLSRFDGVGGASPCWRPVADWWPIDWSKECVCVRVCVSVFAVHRLDAEGGVAAARSNKRQLAVLIL